MNKNKVILFNPRSAKWKHRLPLSVLQVGASIMGKYDYVFVDGNMEEDPGRKYQHCWKQVILSISDAQ
jgi:anaerobic magnesium-protoporphyrin IX monomethyl ester cyclase